VADDGAPGVEFVNGASGDSLEEELPPPAPKRTNPRWTLAGGAVVLVAGALIARGVSHGQEPGSPPLGGTTSSAASTGPSIGAAILGPPESNRPIPDPRRARFAAPLCQRPASCSVVTTLPAHTINALHAAFPGIAVRSASTFLSTRPDKMAPDVITRTINARAGTTTVTIRIQMAAPMDSRHVEQHRGATSTTTVREVTLGYLVSVVVSRPARPVPIATAQRLATDNRLILPV
jgi:hypothetical protein